MARDRYPRVDDRYPRPDDRDPGPDDRDPGSGTQASRTDDRTPGTDDRDLVRMIGTLGRMTGTPVRMIGAPVRMTGQSASPKPFYREAVRGAAFSAATQVLMFCSSRSSGKAPWRKASSWKARTSKAGPSSLCA